METTLSFAAARATSLERGELLQPCQLSLQVIDTNLCVQYIPRELRVLPFWCCGSFWARLVLRVAAYSREGCAECGGELTSATRVVGYNLQT